MKLYSLIAPLLFAANLVTADFYCEWNGEVLTNDCILDGGCHCDTGSPQCSGTMAEECVAICHC
jgi:hypothetical protein